MDAKNGFLTKFCIELVIRFFSQLFFFIEKNNKFENEEHIFRDLARLLSTGKHKGGLNRIFFSTKKKVEKKNRITISMQNFVRNPFLASINATDNSPELWYQIK